MHRPVGVALAEKWQLPPPIVACVREAAEYDKTDRHSLANAVCFGNALAKKSGIAGGPFDADDVDALVMIGRSAIEISDDILKTLTKGLRERVSGLYAQGAPTRGASRPSGPDRSARPLASPSPASHHPVRRRLRRNRSMNGLPNSTSARCWLCRSHSQRRFSFVGRPPSAYATM